MRRRWSDLRPKAPAPETSKEETIEQVLRRVWAGCDMPGDGRRVLLWMKDSAGAVTPPNTPEAILRDREGQRRLIADVISLASATP